MNIQIFGRSKCFDTKKAERWFKERRIKFQSIDLVKYGMSGGEFDSVLRAVGGIDNLIDWTVKDPVIAGLRPFAQTVERPGGIDETTLHGEYLFVTWFVLLYEIRRINARKQQRKEPLKMEQRTKSSVVEAGDFVGCNGEGCLHS